MLLMLSGKRIGYYWIRNSTLLLSSCVSYILQTPVSLLPMAMISTPQDAVGIRGHKVLSSNNFRVPGLSLKYLIHLELISIQQKKKKRDRVLASLDFLRLFVEETVLFFCLLVSFSSVNYTKNPKQHQTPNPTQPIRKLMK